MRISSRHNRNKGAEATSLLPFVAPKNEGVTISVAPSPVEPRTIVSDSGQHLFDFSPRVRTERNFQAVVAPFGVEDLIRFENLDARRTYQFPVVQQLLSRKGAQMLVGPTGSGKTRVAHLKAAQVLARGQQVIFISPQEHLVDQAMDRALSTLKLEPQDLRKVTGDTLAQRKLEGANPPNTRYIFSSPEALLNDLRTGKVDLSRIGLIIYDESHEIRGDSLYSVLKKELRGHRCEELFMSATPGKSKRDIVERLHELRIPRGNLSILEAPRVKLWDDKYDVPLSNELAYGARLLKEAYLGCLDETSALLTKIGKGKWARDLYELHLPEDRGAPEQAASLDPAVMQTPSPKKFKRAADEIGACARKKLDELPAYSPQLSDWKRVISLLAELQHRRTMHQLLSTWGKFSFLDFAFRNYADFYIPIPKKRLTYAGAAFSSAREQLTVELKELGRATAPLRKTLKELTVRVAGALHLPSDERMMAAKAAVDSWVAQNAALSPETARKLKYLIEEMAAWQKVYRRTSESGGKELKTLEELSPRAIEYRHQYMRKHSRSAKNLFRKNGDGSLNLDEAKNPRAFLSRVYEDPKVLRAITAAALGGEYRDERGERISHDLRTPYAMLLQGASWKDIGEKLPPPSRFLPDPRSIRARFFVEARKLLATRSLTEFHNHPKEERLHALLRNGTFPETAKGLVYVESPELAKFLARRLVTLRGEDIACSLLVGKKSLTSRQRRAQLAAFEQGDPERRSVMFMNEAGIQGTDLNNAFFFIYYNVLADPIRIIQSRGRLAPMRVVDAEGLNQKGGIVALIAADTSDEERSRIAHFRYRALTKFLRELAHPGITS